LEKDYWKLTSSVNNINKCIGHNIWQRSFHNHVIRGERDYQKIWAYIDENPCRWREDCFYQNEEMSPSIFRINYNERQLTGIYQLPLEVLL